MGKLKKFNKKALAAAISLAVIAIIAVAMFFVYGAENYGTVTVTFSDGKDDVDIFDVLERSADKSISGCIVVPGESFAKTVTVNLTGADKVVDCETFYFDDNGTKRAYSFTGWHIVGAEDKIPGKTVFQPGDTITPEVLEKYASDGSLELEALWGKCWFAQNPYTNMVYKNVLNAAGKKTDYYELDEETVITTEKSENLTVASDSNNGYTPQTPMASVDAVFEAIRVDNGNAHGYDAYSYVLMLTGDLHYFKNNTRLVKDANGDVTGTDTKGSNFFGYDSNKSDVNTNNIIYTSVTFKSYQENEGNIFELTHKGRSYGPQVYCNLRFDNVKFGSLESTKINGVTGSLLFFPQAVSSEFQLYYGTAHNGDHYFETTARNKKGKIGSPMTTFRPNKHETVVINGGSFGGMQLNYSASDKSETTREWFIGRNASITNVHCGNTSAYVSNNTENRVNFEVYITGGKIENFYGAGNGMNAICSGYRNVQVLGDKSGNTAYDPQIENFYGGGKEARLYGDIEILLDGSTNVINLYGGGCNYSATTYGNIDITVKDSVIQGDLYGGGKNGNTEETPKTYIKYIEEKYEDTGNGTGIYVGTETNISTTELGATVFSRIGKGGEVAINIVSSTVKGDIYGSGMGASQTVDTSSSEPAPSGWYSSTETFVPDYINKPASDYPSYSTEDGRILVLKYYAYTWNYNSTTQLLLRTYKQYAYLSLATVKSVDITIDGSIVGTSTTNGKGNIYGGGSIAKVLEDTKITIKGDSKIYGSVYGGGDGVKQPEQLVVYNVATEAEYKQPEYNSIVIGSDGKPSKVTLVDQVPSVTELKKHYELYTWSGKDELLASGGIDIENKLVYSPNTQGWGSVEGNIEVIIEGGTVHGDVYGGGNKGEVQGSITVTVSGGELGDVYAGCNQADVKGNITLNISGGEIESAFGGNNASGKVDKNINVTMSGGNVTTALFGGGNKAAYAGTPAVTVSGGTLTNVYGGGYAAAVGAGKLAINGGKVSTAFGGGDQGETLGNVSVTVSGNADIGTLYGGANQANVGKDITLTISGGKVSTAFGGGNMGNTNGKITVNVSDGEVTDSIYGGANQANVGEDISLTISGGTLKNAFGGNNASGVVSGTISVNIQNGTVTSVYGGGNEALYEGTPAVTVSGGTLGNVYGGGFKAKTSGGNVTLNGGTIDNVYGGGFAGDVDKSTVTVAGGKVTGSVYGGGYEGNVLSSTKVEVAYGEIEGNVYGGGYAGTVKQTVVSIDDSAVNDIITINGSVFGGGEGTTATVYRSADVTVNLKYEFTATEEMIKIDSQEDSGQIETQITEGSGKYSIIKGSVYGGGDLGMTGEGEINLSQNTADVKTVGATTVTVKNGHIEGSVFGGGNGIPTDATYNVYMGAVFGHTVVNINGGYIEDNVYGGGTQSRLYKDNSSVYAAQVIIDENVGSENVESNKIAIRGSVFGGGDRGNSATTNASVPTTIGDVNVTITGNESGSKIYFVEGGVYGDGNLCLVNGKRTIKMTDFVVGGETGALKTFYSLQRADEVILDNSEFVLLGAIDLVEEGDLSVYSINRVDKLTMKHGSTVKLSQIVKYLAEISSDVDTDETFINLGNNGENAYTEHGSEENPTLYKPDIDAYRAGTYEAAKNGKNTICVANGLYLEIKDSKGNYGPVIGLFTIQLLHANPGEGGGFVYSDITKTTGDFICETTMGYSYTIVTFDESNKFESNKYYIRAAGTYKLAATYDAGEVYYEKVESANTTYMAVIDTVGGKQTDGKFEYYYWYINGSTINYTVNITGYIGAEQTEYSASNIIPKHDKELKYVLFSISEGENKTLSTALKNYTYTLVQTSSGLKDQEIAIEVKMGEYSLGFVSYDGNTETWSIQQNGESMSGYKGKSGELEKNILTTVTATNATNITIVLHKAIGVNAEKTAMSLVFDIDLYDGNNIYSEGTSTLVFNNTFSIIRLVPKQNKYSEASRFYMGVISDQSEIRINGLSSFSMEYQTKYIAMAFPKDENTEMKWYLSTKGYTYYFNDSEGTYMTLDSDGNVINISDTLSYNGKGLGNIQVKLDSGKYTYESGGTTYELQEVYTTSDEKLPKGTKITMIDWTDEKSPSYYYYICNSYTDSIDLMDFYAMGSDIKETVKESSFYTEYITKQKDAVRVNERIVFIFDFSQVDWTAAPTFNGSIFLQHMYNDVDIMDYVESTTTVNATKYIRSYPRTTNFVISNDSKSIEDFSTIEEDTFSEIGETTITVNIKENAQIPDTRFDEGDFTVKIELLDQNGKVILMPAGMSFLRDGKEYFPGIGNKFAIVPLFSTDEVNHASKTDITIRNSMYSLKDYLGENAKNVSFRITLYNAPDPLYYNEIEVSVDGLKLTFALKEKYEYSLKVTSENRVVSSGGQFSASVEKKSNDDAATVEFALYKKENNSYVKIDDISSVLKGNGDYKWDIVNGENISGTYRLIFTYGDKTEYLNFIVK